MAEGPPQTVDAQYRVLGPDEKPHGPVHKITLEGPPPSTPTKPAKKWYKPATWFGNKAEPQKVAPKMSPSTAGAVKQVGKVVEQLQEFDRLDARAKTRSDQAKKATP